MPGVLIVESMAQTAAVLVVKTLDAIDKKMLVYFMSMDKTKFRKPVVPGDRLFLNVNVIKQRKNVWKFYGKGTVNEQIVAESEFTAMMVPPE
jgi:3-hydroxyacyl-[acyl-carrier-protein] dehydratase